MALFARRALKRMLDHLSAHLPEEACKKLAHELDHSSWPLGFEWETALLFGFSQLGKVEYEPASPGGTQPDIAFSETSEAPIRFIADIATVSDEGLEKENPATPFGMALTRLRSKYKLPGSIHYTIKGEITGPRFDDRKPRLKLPRRSEIDKLLKKHVEPQLRRIKQHGLARAIIPIQEPGVELTVRYDSNQRYGSASYLSYTTTYSLWHNTVYSRLDDKLAQLKKSGRTEPFGIFLCDGGCALLKSQKSAASVSIDEVVREFFGKNSSISFVVVLLGPSEQPSAFAGIAKDRRMTARLYINPRAKRPMDKEALLNVINRSMKHWPVAVATVHDALYWLKHGEKNRGEPIHVISYGGTLMSQTFRVSARKIQEMLAGTITPETFCDQHGHPHAPFENPFRKALKLGLTIQSVKLTACPDADDDILEFTFAPDAAIGKLVAKQKAPAEDPKQPINPG